MSVSLVKGQKLSLSKEVEGLSKVVVGLGWDVAKQKKGLFGGYSTPDIDCDASAISIGTSGKARSVAYFGRKRVENDAIIHHGDNLTGAGDGDDEQITVDLKSMPNDVDKVVFAVNIYNCASRRQHFGMIKNAFIRLVDKSTRKEICKYNLSDDYNGKTAMIFGEVYKHNGEWKFNAMGQGTTDTRLEQVVNQYK